MQHRNVRRFSSKPPVSVRDKNTVFQNDRFDNPDNLARGNLLRSSFLPRIIVLELIMQGNSAACYVEKPRLGTSGVQK